MTHPVLQQWFASMKVKFPDAHISSSYRGEAEQNRLFEEKASRLKFPESKHNATSFDGSPQSRALDLFRLEGKHARFPMEWYKAIYEWSDRKGFPVAWGGSWATWKDGPHFELEDLS